MKCCKYPEKHLFTFLFVLDYINIAAALLQSPNLNSFCAVLSFYNFKASY